MNCSSCSNDTETEVVDCEGIKLCLTCASDQGYEECAVCGLWGGLDGWMCSDCFSEWGLCV